MREGRVGSHPARQGLPGQGVAPEAELPPQLPVRHRREAAGGLGRQDDQGGQGREGEDGPGAPVDDVRRMERAVCHTKGADGKPFQREVEQTVVKRETQIDAKDSSYTQGGISI